MSASAQVNSKKDTIQIPVDEYRSLPIPIKGDNAKLGECFVRVTDLPEVLSAYMNINPRVPNKNKNGVLTGPVIKGIVRTLQDAPDQMAIKNQGIYILTEEVSFVKLNGNRGYISFTLSDPEKHGIINGGHTYAAIRDTIEKADDIEKETLKNAFVRLHLYQGISEDLVPQIAEGLNRSKQVDDPSLENLKGSFDKIKKIMKGKLGFDSISYNQGDEGDVYITEILGYIALFNCERYSDKKHPQAIYTMQSTAVKFFTQDMSSESSPTHDLINFLPDILWLADSIRKLTPAAAMENGFKYGSMQLGSDRAGSKKNAGTVLQFIGETMDYRPANGWVYPMLAAFRANMIWNREKGKNAWRESLPKILPAVINDLVGVCVNQHRDNKLGPEVIGRRESVYSQCYDKVELYLAKKGLIQS